MSKLQQSIRNDTQRQMAIVVEPIGLTFEMPPGRELIFEMLDVNETEYVQLYINEPGISIVPTGRMVEVWENGKLIEKINLE